MPLPIEIQNALRVYDNNKGFWRRLFRRDQAAIRALRSLNDTEQMNLLKIYQCFIENLPKITQESYKVYQAVIAYLRSPDTDLSGIPGVIDTLHFAKLLKSVNLGKLTLLKGNHFRLLENLLSQLSRCMLLNQTNFDDLAKHFEAVEGNIPEELGIIASAVDILNGRCLNQENFNTILKKPNVAANIASALVVLNQSELLSSVNRSQLLVEENQFLLSNDAYTSVWHPLETYLPQLADVNERQSAFDNIFDLAQQENPAEKIENYMRELNAESDKPRPRSRTYTNDKFFTAPPPRTRSRTSMENLIDQSPSNRPGTL
ncbi:MAG: hypothetical protein RJA83_255 [Pseudomonadota bacterium]|jgi:hypothetical protein